MNTTIEVELNGETVEVKGYFHKAKPMSEDRMEPPQNEDFEVEEVIYQGINLFKILSADQIEELSILAAEKLS